MFKNFLLLVLIVFANISFATKAFAESPFGERPEVKKFIHQMVIKHHFNERQLVTLFDQVQVRKQVIHHLRSPLESSPWYRYQMLFVTEWRIREGVHYWEDHKDVLSRAEKKYGVPASIIVATLGIETKYGHNTGGYRVIDALTNIAFSNSPRSRFFKSELEQFLLLTKEKHLDPLKVMGSYAGAIGQPQFMPSSYRRYAVDFSGDNKADLSHNEDDIIASIANYYHLHGWIPKDPVAMPAIVTGYQYQTLLSNPKANTVNTLINYGIIPRGKVSSDQKANVIKLRGFFRDEYWLSFHNFNVIKAYNPSLMYAMAVFQLSEYITALKVRLHD